MKNQINIILNKESLDLIDEGATTDKRSRSNFLEIAGIERAKKILDERGDNDGF